MDKISIALDSLKSGGTRQEEFRTYDLNEGECIQIEGYLFDFAEHHLNNLVSIGSAIELGESTLYYISQGVYGRAIVAHLNEEEGALRLIGDSQALGAMKSDLEKKFGEPIKLIGMIKTRMGVENMGLSR